MNKKAIKEYIIDKISSNTISKFVMVMMDIDYFKEINDNYGHMFGDEVLIKVSDVLKNTIGERGAIGRIGGDEFLLILNEIELEADIRAILKAIRSQIEWAYFGHIKITTSLGSACYPKDGKTYEELFKLSDKCLYIAKEKGRNRFIIYNEKKHGSLSSIQISSNAISMKPKSSTAKKCSHICKIINNISSEKFSVKEIMDSLIDYYSFDKSAIFLNEKIYSQDFDDENSEIYKIIYEYKDLFNENNMFIISDYISIEKKAPKLFCYMLSKKLFSSLQYIICDKNGDIKGLILLATYNRKNKWSEGDINYLTIIFKLIEQKLLKENL